MPSDLVTDGISGDGREHHQGDDKPELKVPSAGQHPAEDGNCFTRENKSDEQRIFSEHSGGNDQVGRQQPGLLDEVCQPGHCSPRSRSGPVFDRSNLQTPDTPIPAGTNGRPLAAVPVTACSWSCSKSGPQTSRSDALNLSYKSEDAAEEGQNFGSARTPGMRWAAMPGEPPAGGECRWCRPQTRLYAHAAEDDWQATACEAWLRLAF